MPPNPSPLPLLFKKKPCDMIFINTTWGTDAGRGLQPTKTLKATRYSPYLGLLTRSESGIIKFGRGSILFAMKSLIDNKRKKRILSRGGVTNTLIPCHSLRALDDSLFWCVRCLYFIWLCLQYCKYMHRQHCTCFTYNFRYGSQQQQYIHPRSFKTHH